MDIENNPPKNLKSIPAEFRIRMRSFSEVPSMFPGCVGIGVYQLDADNMMEYGGGVTFQSKEIALQAIDKLRKAVEELNCE